MRLLTYLAVFALLTSCSFPVSFPTTGKEWIEASIRYHDPNGKWNSLRAGFLVEDSLPPGRDSRSYTFSLDNSKSQFIYRFKDLEFEVIGDSLHVQKGEVDKERALRLRNYYTFLWGLPMKLMDPGTVIEDSVREEILQGKTYQVVRVPYEKDIWYFYLNPENYRMEAYKFYQDEPQGKGEIIYLEGEYDFSGMKIPKNRTWYRTEKPEFLGTDMLKSVDSTD
ncbi:DUF6503 family protein [Algoriphagus taiwanensis]|uniref:Lipoprotein n=1 Tax=Algoriphagus taiwanensis TaxID=1445656 RepID=A0ABQ6Q5G4_9BACT|nr:hypothetical protein Ataiwa_36900 [Algoriphagus taiwanensis]